MIQLHAIESFILLLVDTTLKSTSAYTSPLGPKCTVPLLKLLFVYLCTFSNHNKADRTQRLIAFRSVLLSV